MRDVAFVARPQLKKWPEWSLFYTDSSKRNLDFNLKKKTLKNTYQDGQGNLSGLKLYNHRTGWESPLLTHRPIGIMGRVFVMVHDMPSCLTLSIIRVSGVVPFPSTWCSSYGKGSLRVALDYGRLIYNIDIERDFRKFD